MRASARDFRQVGMVAGMAWVAAFLITASQSQPVDPLNPVAGLWTPPSGQAIEPDRPIPLFRNPDASERDHPLRLAVRAAFVTSEGGELRCGRARLVVPAGATKSGGFFLLEDFSGSALSFEFLHTAADLRRTLPLTLEISYGGTQYGDQCIDPAGLDIFRERAPGAFQRISTRLDRDAQCVATETIKPGRYVVG